VILEFWNWEIEKRKPQIRRFFQNNLRICGLNSILNFPISQFQNLPIPNGVPLSCQDIIFDIDPESKDHIDNHR